MIDYETFCKIRDYHEQRGLKIGQIAQALGLDWRTVAKWIGELRFRPRKCTARASKLDPYKSQIRQWLEFHPYTAQQVFQRLCEDRFEGGYSIVKDSVRSVRPRPAPAFLTLSFAPGECAQVDWGSYGTVPVGQTRRKLSFFVMVLCYCRLLYLEFTLAQTLEQFLACHQHAFEFFGSKLKLISENPATQKPNRQSISYRRKGC
jgi:transposase